MAGDNKTGALKRGTKKKLECDPNNKNEEGNKDSLMCRPLRFVHLRWIFARCGVCFWHCLCWSSRRAADGERWYIFDVACARIFRHHHINDVFLKAPHIFLPSKNGSAFLPLVQKILEFLLVLCSTRNGFFLLLNRNVQLFRPLQTKNGWFLAQNRNWYKLPV